MNEFEKKVYEALKKRYQAPEWLILYQVKTHTGVTENGFGSRYIDFFIINMWPSKNYSVITVEAKQGLSDFKKDILDLRKQIQAKFYSDQFYWLITSEMWEKHNSDIRKLMAKNMHDGLMVLNDNGVNILFNGYYRNKEKSPWSWGFIMSLLRNAAKM